ncbi:MAG TPA: hypothetical protein VF040_02060 [Ktedonobacterales bacterium]
MNNKVDLETRLHFRDWLRQELRQLDFYQRRGDHYLIREFAKYCVEHGSPIDEASLGRYLRDEEPVLPTPERCRALARVFGYAPVNVLIHAGYLEGDDLFPPLPEKAEDAAKEVLKRKELIAKAASEKGLFEPLGTLIEQMQQSTPEFFEEIATRQDAPEIRDVFARTAKSKSPGASAIAAQALEEFNKVQEQVTADRGDSSAEQAPAKGRQPGRPAGKKSTEKAGSR